MLLCSPITQGRRIFNVSRNKVFSSSGFVWFMCWASKSSSRIARKEFLVTDIGFWGVFNIELGVELGVELNFCLSSISPFHNVEKEIYAKMVTFTKGANIRMKYFPKRCWIFQRRLKRSSTRSSKSFKKIFFSSLMWTWAWIGGNHCKKWTCIQYSRNLNIKKLGHIARSNANGDEMVLWIDIWLKPDLEHQQLGSLTEKDLQGTKPLEFFFGKRTYLY